MPIMPMHSEDSAAAAAAHLWHLIYQLGGSPGALRGGALGRWCELAVELTILSEQLRARRAGRRTVPFEDGRTVHVAAIRAALLTALDSYQGAPCSREVGA